MYEITKIETVETQLIELEMALSNNNYSALQNILLQQALSLHMVGIDFMQKSEESANLKFKRACVDIAIRSFGQSLKSMRAVKEMGK